MLGRASSQLGGAEREATGPRVHWGIRAGVNDGAAFGAARVSRAGEMKLLGKARGTRAVGCLVGSNTCYQPS